MSYHDFEAGLPDDVGIRRNSWVLSDATTAATGKGSARIVNLSANDFFSAFFKQNPYLVNRYPHIAFDYRFEVPHESMLGRWRNPERSPYNLNLVAIVNGDMQIMKFIGGPNAYKTFTDNSIGEVEGVKDDGQWHHAKIDFGALLQKRYPKAPRLFADYVGTWSTGPRGYENPQGASLWLDNITFYSAKASSAGFEWSVPDDDNGISGYSYVLDQKPDTLPDEKIETQATKADFKNLKPGMWHFHLRARDGAGNWSAVAHSSFELTAVSGKGSTQ